MYTQAEIELLERAQRWAAQGHLGVNRKHSDLPYIVHPEAVAQIVAEIVDDADVLAAAWLHDYYEDVKGARLADIEWAFNSRVSELVREVSKVSVKTDGNRKTRVAKDREHYAKSSKWAKIIKLADMIHNLPTMIRDNPKFAPQYVSEKELLLEVIKDGSPLLASIAEHIIEDFKKSLTPMDVYSSIKEIKR